MNIKYDTFVNELALQLRNNWRKFDCFYWDNEYKLPDSNNWCIVYTHNRDSGLLEQSNASAIAQIMNPFLEGDDLLVEDHNHWAVGWIAGYALRVHPYCDGKINEAEYAPAFLAWCDIQQRLENYPLLDEEDYSRRQHEACFENMSYEAGRMVKDDCDEEYLDKVYTYISNNYPNELEDKDDQGAYPSEEIIAEALHSLGLLDDDYLHLVED